MNLAVPHVVRAHNMQVCLERGIPRLPRAWPEREGWLSIVGFGPSLLTTWYGIVGDILTISGAHDFLISRRLMPTYHLDCDPRIHKSHFVAHPRIEVQYLMASCCHPQTWDYLARARVLAWHADNGPESRAWVAEHDSGEPLYGQGCSSAGLKAVPVARALGYRKLRFYGFDSCYSDDGRLHPYIDAGTGPCYEIPQPVEADGVTYLTTENMKRQAHEFLSVVRGVEFEIIGEGLLSSLVKLAQREIAA